jgi:formylglycine-generating enzyme required for sulfatase activity
MRRLLLATGCALWLGGPAAAATIDWVTVGDPGNPADTEVMTCCGTATGTTGYGSVADVYRIGKYKVTNAQYAEFLNAVADTDTYRLYNEGMGDPNAWARGGITRSGTSGSYTYSTIAGREDMPVNLVSFWDALRFANWLHNGQPTGAQDNSTTEDGAYTITAQGIANNSITRNAGATIFLASEDEWYKAAYYDALSSSYFDYPAGSNAQTTCALPGATPNTANCGSQVWDLTDVGRYTGSPSPNGTFDQGGNVWEWNEAIISNSVSTIRGLRGGSFQNAPGDFAASFRLGDSPASEALDVGFRVAMIPEPGTGLLLGAGVLGLAAGRRRSQRFKT